MKRKKYFTLQKTKFQMDAAFWALGVMLLLFVAVTLACVLVRKHGTTEDIDFPRLLYETPKVPKLNLDVPDGVVKRMIALVRESPNFANTCRVVLEVASQREGSIWRSVQEAAYELIPKHSSSFGIVDLGMASVYLQKWYPRHGPVHVNNAFVDHLEAQAKVF